MSSERDQKIKALQLTVDKLEKTYGKGTIMKLGDKQITEVEVINTGSLGLDIALGVGGLPKGRVIEIYGPESSGKTTLAIHAIAECQKKGGMAAFIAVSYTHLDVYKRQPLCMIPLPAFIQRVPPECTVTWLPRLSKCSSSPLSTYVSVAIPR